MELPDSHCDTVVWLVVEPKSVLEESLFDFLYQEDFISKAIWLFFYYFINYLVFYEINYKHDLKI